MGMDLGDGDLAMTNQTAQLHARYARIYAAVVILTATALLGSVWANTTGPQTGIDVSALMQNIDTSRLPIQTNPDAF
jgi:hypothetical protein